MGPNGIPDLKNYSWGRSLVDSSVSYSPFMQWRILYQYSILNQPTYWKQIHCTNEILILTFTLICKLDSEDPDCSN